MIYKIFMYQFLKHVYILIKVSINKKNLTIISSALQADSDERK